MDQVQQFWWQWWVYAAGTVATVSAVVVALLHDRILARLFPPELRLSLVSPLGMSTPVNIGPKPGTSVTVLKSRYYHLEVSNIRRWRPATETAIYLMRVDVPGPNGEPQTVWSQAVPMKWPFQEHILPLLPFQRTVGPSLMCDLCHVIQGQGLSVEPAVQPMSLMPYLSRRPFGQPLDMTLWFQARGREADSPITGFRITWNGNWNDGDQEMAKNLIIENKSG